jgi:hypothetical protein
VIITQSSALTSLCLSMFNSASHASDTVKTGIFYVFNVMGVISFLEGNNACFLVSFASPLSLINRNMGRNAHNM